MKLIRGSLGSAVLVTLLLAGASGPAAAGTCVCGFNAYTQCDGSSLHYISQCFDTDTHQSCGYDDQVIGACGKNNSLYVPKKQSHPKLELRAPKTAITTQSMNGVSCPGPAAADVSVVWDGTKYNTTNHGKRSVHVVFTLIWGGSIDMTLSPGQSDYPKALGDPNYPIQAFKDCNSHY